MVSLMRVSIKNGQLRFSLLTRIRWKVEAPYWTATVWFIDRLPWFARKRLLNWIFPDSNFHDFHQSDRIAHGGSLNGASIKW